MSNNFYRIHVCDRCGGQFYGSALITKCYNSFIKTSKVCFFTSISVNFPYKEHKRDILRFAAIGVKL